MRARISRNLALLVIFLLLLILVQVPFPTVQTSTIIRVPEDCPTIQEGVDKAAPGDIIEVSADVYYENIAVTKSLTLKGQDKSNTVIDGNGTGNVVTLTASGVTLSGFTIRNGGVYIGVQIDTSGGHKIVDNIISNNVYGIDLFEVTSGNTIVGNTLIKNAMIGINVAYSSSNNISNNHISESTYGIRLDGTSQYNSIAGNTILKTSYGIFVANSPNNSIDRNNVSGKISGIYSIYSPYTNIRNNTVSGCAYGIEPYQCQRSTIFGNTLSDNGYGIYLVYSTTNTLDRNLASNNYWGIGLFDSDSNTVIQNTASYNAHGIYIVSYSTGNVIAWNNIMNNTMQKWQDTTSGTNTWYNAIAGKRYGNYWSDYIGEDTNDDGVGDTIIPHAGVDYYPLINPWSTVHDIAIISVVPSKNAVYQGQTVNITVVARNEGTTTETFNVTAKYFNRIIGTKTVTNLARYARTTLVFNWNTAGVPTGFNYEISAEASPVAGETDTLDNIFIDGTITVEKPATTISVFPANIIGPPPNIAETFVVNVTVSNVFDLWAWQVGITFNPNVLEALSFAEGSFLATGGTTLWEPATINNTLGIVEPHRCTLTSGSTPVSGSGTLASITFRVRNYGNSTLHLGPDPSEENVILFDSSWRPIPVNLEDGYFELPWPPVASFTFSPSTPHTIETVTFNATSSYDPDGYILTYFWDFGDGTSGTGKVATHSFDDDGTYTVALTVTDNDGLTNTTSADVTVLNRSPDAIFTESAETVPTGEAIYLNASDSYDPDGTIVSYFWDFGDETNGTGVAVNHVYADDGFYTVTLTVTDDDGATASTSATKTITNRPPVAIFTESAETVDTGEAIHFNATESYDPDGYIISYFWDFGDGTDATGITVLHAYADDGNYTVTLTITDDDSATAFTTSTKTVLNRPPVASFTESATTVPTGEIITFNASASYDPDGYIISYRWDFGDETNASGVIVEHAYANDGNYIVTLTVTDDDGATDTMTSTKSILNRPPVASFTESATTVPTGQLITFNASASYDSDGYIVSYFWDFGDGTNASGVVVEHAYVDDGLYIVTLTVTDDDETSASASATKTILNRPPVASFVESAETVYTGETITFNASGSHDLDGTIAAYFWDFGDSTNATGVTVGHAYADDGAYTVTLKVTDDDGAIASTSAAKTVLNRSPVASFTESATIVLTGEVIHFNASSSYDLDGSIFSYFWNFGDGTNSTGLIVDHAYFDDGTYIVILTVTDDDGASHSTSATKTVLNRSPVADFTYSPPNPFINEPVTFNASTSFDPDGYVVSYLWDFGDGTNATGKTVVHAYAEIGAYNVALSVTDDDGATDTTTVAVTVSSFVRDVAVVDVVLSATEAYPTWIVLLNITVTVENQGERTETFEVTVYYNLTAIGTQTVTLAQGASITLIFSWNLSGVAEGTYTIRAEASVLFGETDIADNSLIDGTIKLKHPGDANDDGTVNVYDLNMLAKALGTSVGDPNYDLRADFNGDGAIDDYDIEILQLYWGS